MFVNPAPKDFTSTAKKDVLSENTAPGTDISIEKRALWWLLNGETGTSSKTICATMLGMIYAAKDSIYYCYPLDPSDFRRCKLLLDLIPEWRTELSRVAQEFPGWGALVAHWGELESLYDEECHKKSAPKLYKRIQELLGLKM